MIMYKIILLLQKNNLTLGTAPKIQLCPVHIGLSYIRKKYIKKTSVRKPERRRPLGIILKQISKK
jgi:hypothetical protein